MAERDDGGGLSGLCREASRNGAAEQASEASRSASLRRRILVLGGAVALFTAAALVVLVHVSVDMRQQLSAATEALVEELRIRDRINQAVMRQLATASAYSVRQNEAIRREFQEAGDAAYDQIQLYLFRDLSLDERVQLEMAKEEHQRLEVAAAQASNLFRRAESEEAQAAREAMIGHAFALLDALDAFLQMREENLDRLKQRQEDTFQAIYMGGGGLALFLVLSSLLLSLYVNRSVVRPLGSLADAADRLGRGDLDVRVPVGHHQEFASVACGFNRMAENLEQASADLEARNEELVEALGQVRAAQAELIHSEKLSAMGRMTAGIAHELNNPLASVLGYAELLSDALENGDRPPADEIREEFLAPILQQAARAQHLVQDFLRFARQSDKELGPVRVTEAMEIVANLQRYAFEKAGFELRTEQVPDVWVLAEPQQVQGIFLNLVTNALHAMEKEGGTHLQVRGVVGSETVDIIFEDDGPGIEQPDKIFEPFFTTKPVGEGAGLGLALAHRFMNEFGGSIRVTNRPDGGARFTLTFQLTDCPAEDSAADGEAADWKAASRRRDAEQPAILVVEDEEPLRRLHERILGRVDADAILASSVDEARRILAERRIDMVISDVKMPGESGLDFYEWVMGEVPGLKNRFLFVTGDIQAPEIEELAAARPEIFIHKPFQLDEFLERVHGMLREQGPAAAEHP